MRSKCDRIFHALSLSLSLCISLVPNHVLTLSHAFSLSITSSPAFFRSLTLSRFLLRSCSPVSLSRALFRFFPTISLFSRSLVLSFVLLRISRSLLPLSHALFRSILLSHSCLLSSALFRSLALSYSFARPCHSLALSVAFTRSLLIFFSISHTFSLFITLSLSLSVVLSRFSRSLQLTRASFRFLPLSHSFFAMVRSHCL